MEKTVEGSCHCKAVRFSAEMDLGKGTIRCNCSLCSKARSWFAFVPANKLKILSGKGSMADFQWTPEGKPKPNLHYHFCTNCGVRVFAQGDQQALGGKFYAVAIAALDDIDPDELVGKIKYVDGLHDHYDREPTDTRLM